MSIEKVKKYDKRINGKCKVTQCENDYDNCHCEVSKVPSRRPSRFTSVKVGDVRLYIYCAIVVGMCGEVLCG